MIHIYTGDGKGKTTAALGLALRTALTGKKVHIVQFLKGGGYTGELVSIGRIDNLKITQFGFGCHMAAEIASGRALCIKCGVCFRENRNPVHDFAGKAFRYAQSLVTEGNVDLLILDEISHAIRHKLLSVEAVLALIKSRPTTMDIVLTGRNMAVELLAEADSITECQAVKHPMSQGIPARWGIEY